MSRYVERFISNNVTLDSPYWLQELAGNFFLSYINFSNLNYLRFKKFLSASQYFSRWQLERYQTERLKLLLNYAYKNVPYYRDIFVKNNLVPEDINSLKDLRKLPFLTREDIIKNIDKLISSKIDKKFLFSVRTSGSTGIPVQFYRDIRYEYINYAFYRRTLASLGVAVNHNRGALIWLRPFVLGNVSSGYAYDPCLKELSLATLRKGLPCWDEKLELIRKFKPFYLFAGSSTLYDFACYVKKHNIDDIALQCIVSSFENLFPCQREFIEKQFRCKAYNYYVCTERVISAWECLNQDGMHIDMERGIVEIVDDNGELLSDGHSGRIIATALHIFAMPLIRYDTGDIGSISDSPCACNRGSPLLKSFEGRINEVIRYKDKFIWSSALALISSQFKNIEKCQFVQEKETELIVNIVRRDGFSENDAKGIVAYLHNLIDEKLVIKLNFVEQIPRTEMGKFPFIISKVKPYG
ncbi:MAG: hypothetical protein AMJ95_02350 [Omnitrophica WOR_2 bacterium SM23_72]|nr:MAG: hypothetical protein AMJ95_02350 [Omnitrophica WOR_2 bacterium SM23_72]